MLHVIEGKVTVQLGDRTLVLEAGQAGFLPKGVPHTFRVDSDEARMLEVTTPGGFARFVSENSEPASELSLPKGPPSIDPEALGRSAANHGAPLVGPPLAPAALRAQQVDSAHGGGQWRAVHSWSDLALSLSGLTMLAACDGGKPYDTTSGVGIHYTVVMGGVEVGDRRKITPPAGTSIDVGSSLVFRYQTPCGPRDVPMKVKSIDKNEHSRTVNAEPAEDRPPPRETLVIADARGGVAVDLRIGSAKVPSAESGHSHHEKEGAWYGRVVDVDCAKTHEITWAGAAIGTLPGQAPDHPDKGKPGFDRIVWVSPKKDTCFVARYAAVESTRGGTKIGDSGNWLDVELRGAGWLPFDPDVFMKEATDAKAPMAFFEAPCR